MERTKTAVLTGSTGGLGAAITRLLADEGWKLVLLNRPSERSDRQARELADRLGDERVHLYPADLMDLDEVSGAIDRIRADHAELHALYNMSGVLTDTKVMSRQGAESHFAVNTLVPYVLSTRLRDRLASGATPDDPALVVNTSSGVVKSVKRLDVASLRDPEEVGGLMGAYAQSKLAVTAVTCMLEQAFAQDGVVVVSVDPGPMKTAMTSNNTAMPWFLRLLVPVLFKSPESVAQRMLRGLESARVGRAGGAFLSIDKRIETPAIAMDAEVHAKLRDVMEAIIG
ncbi:MAG: SDR family NAD(P)-dependent oxidoreductase [Planctomycetota bacterium]